MKKTHQTPEERIKGVLKYLTTVYNRTQVPTSSKIVFGTGKTKMGKNGKTQPVTLTSESGIGNAYGMQLLADLGIIEITGNDGKVSKFLLWIWGDAPTLETAKYVEETRVEIKRKNLLENMGIFRILDNLGDSVIDKFIAENPEKLTNYTPRDSTVEDIQRLLSILDMNTKIESLPKDELFNSAVKDKYGQWEVVNMLDRSSCDSKFNSSFCVKWEIVAVNPEDEKMKYIGDSPVTMDYARKVQLILNKWKEIYIEPVPVVEPEPEIVVEETPPLEGYNVVDVLERMEEILSKTTDIYEKFIKLHEKNLAENQKGRSENLEQSIALKEAIEKHIKNILELAADKNNSISDTD